MCLSCLLCLSGPRTPTPTPWGRTTPARRVGRPSETSTISTVTACPTQTRSRSPVPSASSASRGRTAWATTCAPTRAAWRNPTFAPTVERLSPGNAAERMFPTHLRHMKNFLLWRVSLFFLCSQGPTTSIVTSDRCTPQNDPSNAP